MSTPATTNTAKGNGAAVLGIGAAACAACCVGPILGFLAALGIGTAAAFTLFGMVGLVVAAIVGLVMHRRRRRRAIGCAAAPTTVAVTAPVSRSGSAAVGRSRPPWPRR
ncbi:MAG: hypothetical protein RL238_1655 [Actinomycetota bacterium]|jgi:hypothetical protein